MNTPEKVVAAHLNGKDAQVPHLVDEAQISSQISLAARLLQKAARVRLGEVGAWPGQIPLLLWLLEEGNLIQKELIARTGMEQSTVAEHLDRMERMGLVKREREPQDRRAFRICLTDKGRAISGDLVENIKEGVPIFTKGLTSDQLAGFNQAINTIIDNLNTYLRQSKAKR
ncbi:MarR family winged helix-turn-helix transcriptional regulator [Novosphingobium album (ex Liu et al. 2023)]|uniref:MarR family winged helix-turn-helix transcriptional regulator n=1 Tax=Novosphingobium album (ex Liu et al. 2023) TaxID=3031130 RepID=A0ABT5WNA3_9SPHN|nr:MarR family winged helix-turn-helix transcriptional regulator [Novosphingobium album (ex Liu et al. 2023)]MDE8651531.1 MarR family winged helix-turn-helix transcriptional regulator [Novosphingobium album (ex Liu et al. 2023)]